MPRNNQDHWTHKGPPVPKSRKHKRPTATLSSADIAALTNMDAHDGEIMYSITVGHIIPNTGQRSVPEPGHRVWAQYPTRP